MKNSMKTFDYFNVRVLQQHDRYGLRDCLVHNEAEPLIEFYDNRYTDADDWKRGQFCPVLSFQFDGKRFCSCNVRTDP